MFTPDSVILCISICSYHVFVSCLVVIHEVEIISLAGKLENCYLSEKLLGEWAFELKN